MSSQGVLNATFASGPLLLGAGAVAGGLSALQLLRVYRKHLIRIIPAQGAQGAPTMSEQWHIKSGLPKPGGLARQLWDEASPIAFESLHCPFVIAMAQGTLPK